MASEFTATIMCLNRISPFGIAPWASARMDTPNKTLMGLGQGQNIWELFIIRQEIGDPFITWTIKSVANLKYVTILTGEEHQLAAKADAANTASEVFYPALAENGELNISWNDGGQFKFVSNDLGKNCTMVADRAVVGPWERFKLFVMSGDQPTLRSGIESPAKLLGTSDRQVIEGQKRFREASRSFSS